MRELFEDSAARAVRESLSSTAMSSETFKVVLAPNRCQVCVVVTPFCYKTVENLALDFQRNEPIIDTKVDKYIKMVPGIDVVSFGLIRASVVHISASATS